MRESIGGAWLLGIVMVFMMVFVAYVSITINYSNAYKLKTEMVTVIEQYGGMNSTSVGRMERLMANHSYLNTITCERETGEVVLGVTGSLVTKNPKTPQNYCVKREIREASDAKYSSESKYYYTVTVAFNFTLPILGELFKFKVNGETNVIYYPNDQWFD